MDVGLLDSLAADLSEVGLVLVLTKLWFCQVKVNRLRQSRLIMESHCGFCQATLCGNGWVHVNCLRIGTKIFGWGNTISSTRRKRIMPTNGFWRTGWFSFLSVSAVLMQVFQVGIVPFTANAYKPWTFMFGNSADPLRALRRTLTGHSNDMKFCTLGTNEQHILLAAQRLRVGPEFVVVRIGHWQLTLPNVNAAWDGYKESCIGNPWGKGGCAGQNSVGRANWRCIVVTKDWVTGRKQHKI